MDKTLMQYKTSNKNVFEGYYFKHTFNNTTISFIVGFSTSDQICFIQVIESNLNTSKYYKFDISKFTFNNNPFYIKIENNFFSFEKIIVELDEYIGTIEYHNLTPVKKFLVFDNIMGPFSILPKMKCNHAIISMDHTANISMIIHGKQYIKKGRGYIEKDYGSTFPKNYVWIQCNDFLEEHVSLFFSIASIPYMGINFDGVICNLVINNLEYRFATYNGAKYYIDHVKDDQFCITLTQGKTILTIKALSIQKTKLAAPKDGEMSHTIKECLNSHVEINLTVNNSLVYSGSSKQCAVELTNHYYFHN